jgi:type I restriction enzyme M protein
MKKPSWFKDGSILVVNSQTCGINKDGREQYLVNKTTGERSESSIDDELADCCESIVKGVFKKKNIFYKKYHDVIKSDVYVPKYFDGKSINALKKALKNENSLTLKSLGELEIMGEIKIFGGHGSPSSDQRLGDIPYIKVSDLRAGHVNINPSNMIPIELAEKFWRSNNSGFKAYDLISPERASKNIGEFCVLMPGQEKAVFTKEVIVIRATENSRLTQFYLMWALSIKEVREQWNRVVFMQTNREDVGNRVNEILIPFPSSKSVAQKFAKAFSSYYQELEKSRRKFVDSINAGSIKHHIHLGE